MICFCFGVCVGGAVGQFLVCFVSEPVYALGPSAKSYWQHFGSLHLQNGVMYRHFESVGGRPMCQLIVLPKALKKDLLTLIHQGIAGHLGQPERMWRGELTGIIGDETLISSTGHVMCVIVITEERDPHGMEIFIR